MATVVRTLWINPLTGSTKMPTGTGEILQAAISYWEDEVMEWRTKRPRKPADKAAKERAVTKATERLERFRRARERYAISFKDVDKLALQLATDDLSLVMKT